ncbi:MAG: hypothetical protein ACL7BU_15625 [Candidatus Phlomobacter fragariae]
MYDGIYEATKINTHGRILFQAMQNKILNQNITNSRDIFIIRRDKGAYLAVWQLPTIQYSGQLKVNAA